MHFPITITKSRETQILIIFFLSRCVIVDLLMQILSVEEVVEHGKSTK